MLHNFRAARVLTHQVPLLIMLALTTSEFGPDSFCHQCQAQSGLREGKVCTLCQREGGRNILVPVVM